MDSHTPDTNAGPPNEAPRFSIPNQRIVSVEHPCIVQNVDKAVAMLGGGGTLSEVLNNASQKTLPLIFTPGGQSISSINNQANNVLLQISVPKRIGKRKRGSQESFQSVTETENNNAQSLLRSIKDNPEQVQVVPLGMVENSHVFRTLPDFIYSTKDSSFKSEVSSKLIGGNLDSIKTFQLPGSRGLQNTEMFPPPVLSLNTLPQAYAYTERTSFKPKQGTVVGRNTSKIAHDTELQWPTAYEISNSTRLDTRPQNIKDMAATCRQLFGERPIWSLEALAAKLPPGALEKDIRISALYIAFEIMSGPWSNTFCRYKVDPRTSPKYAKYQTIPMDPPSPPQSQLQMPPDDTTEAGPQSQLPVPLNDTTEAEQHPRPLIPPDDATKAYQPAPKSDYGLFAYPVADTQRTIQLVDIVDQKISDLTSPPFPDSLRNKCERIHHGWYFDGTLAKIQLLLRVKLNGGPGDDESSNNTTEPAESRAMDFEAILALPDHADLRVGEDDIPTPGGSIISAKKYWRSCYRQIVRAGMEKVQSRVEGLADSKEAEQT
ncbi:Transcription factor tau 95 kDa subunit [Cyphellophora attinorum]|uniref:Transcription factor tau 95 kDa subunit n=1 Tax=Cyphellophora attinorum TaxID=1664694 RepID=A0A0N1H5S3_9EURO|nr:Transcription factor tau 95 kDa subunit [Phialophora attinorum]KPI36462.1 Transcription factor tau 95 kDa subunit [Phialophora attinorum]